MCRVLVVKEAFPFIYSPVFKSIYRAMDSMMSTTPQPFSKLRKRDRHRDWEGGVSIIIIVYAPIIMTYQCLAPTMSNPHPIIPGVWLVRLDIDI